MKHKKCNFFPLCMCVSVRAICRSDFDYLTVFLTKLMFREVKTHHKCTISTL